MNVYNEAHSLAQAIKESEEYKQREATRQKVEANPDMKKMLEDFQAKQMEVQIKQMTGEEIGPEFMESVQKLGAIVMADPLAAEYMQCEMRFEVMMQDVMKIIGDAVGGLAGMPTAEEQ